MLDVLGSWSQALLGLYASWQVQFQECVNDSYDVWASFHYIPYLHHYIQTLNAECEIEWSISLCVFAMFDNISCTNTLNMATFIEKQLHISVVYDHHWAINAVF